MRNLSTLHPKTRPGYKIVAITFTMLTLASLTLAEKEEPLNQAPPKYHFSKKTGDINLEDIQQFDEVDNIIDEDIDLRVKQATEKMMQMTIEDNVDHIDSDIQNYDKDTIPKDYGPTMSRKRDYKLPKSLKKRELIDKIIQSHRDRTSKLFEKADVLENYEHKLSNSMKGRPVDVLSLQKGRRVHSRPLMNKISTDGLGIVRAELKKLVKKDERKLHQLHVHSYYKNRNKKRRNKKKKKMQTKKIQVIESKKKKRRLKSGNQFKKTVGKKSKMNVRVLHMHPKKKHRKLKAHRARKRKLMIPGAGGGGVVVAPNQGAGIANAQVIVNSLGTPATVPYAKGNAVPAYAPEDTAPKVIVTRMKMPSNLPY